MAISLQKILLLLTLAYAGFVLFTGIGEQQLEIYDEARRGVNALEMARGESHPLVPTYAGEADHWGTKPPFLVWCQAFWIKLLGPGELPVRLPAVLATLSLCILMIWWTGRDWNSPYIGALASLVLLSNWQFMGNHGARSGDFDALLLLFLFVQVMGTYRWVIKDDLRWLWVAALGVLLAGWTKGVAGGFVLPAIGLWLLTSKEGRRQLLRPWVYLGFGLAILGVLVYYFMRNGLDPGYFELVRANELGGRFSSATEGHTEPWYFYLRSLVFDRSGGHLYPLLIPAVAVGLFLPKHRQLTLLTFLAGSTALVVISLAATKLYWYQGPVLPFFSLLIGLLLFELSQRLKEKFSGVEGTVLVASFLLGFLLLPALQIVERVWGPQEHAETPLRKIPFRDFMLEEEVQPPYTLAIRDYNPNARFYAELAGKEVAVKAIKTIRPPVVVTNRPAGPFLVGERVVICSTPTWDYFFKRFDTRELHHAAPCKLVLLVSEREVPLE
jgi:4-amino-4-deoxy-L-arabinose transferase-like glycosyltransferase